MCTSSAACFSYSELKIILHYLSILIGKKKKSNLLPWAKFLTYLNKLIGKLKDFWEREETKETLSFLHSCSTAPDPFSSAANNRQ